MIHPSAPGWEGKLLAESSVLHHQRALQEHRQPSPAAGPQLCPARTCSLAPVPVAGQQRGQSSPRGTQRALELFSSRSVAQAELRAALGSLRGQGESLAGLCRTWQLVTGLWAGAGARVGTRSRAVRD